MGNRNSLLSTEQLEFYKENTYFSKKEILHICEKFQRELFVGENIFDVNARVSMEDICELKELKVRISTTPAEKWDFLSHSRVCQSVMISGTGCTGVGQCVMISGTGCT